MVFIMKHTVIYRLAITLFTILSLSACTPMLRGGPAFPFIPIFPVVIATHHIAHEHVDHYKNSRSTREAFYDADVDGNEVLSRQEFSRSVLVNRLFAKTDKNDDYSISEKEFSVLLVGKEAFIKADKNEDEALSQLEF